MQSLPQVNWTGFQETDALLFLVGAGIKSFLILSIVTGVCWTWRRGPADALHWIWLLGLTSLLLVPWLSLSPLWQGPRWDISAELQPGNVVTLALGNSGGEGRLSTSSATPPQSVAATRAGTTTHKPQLTTHLHRYWLKALPAVWLVGVVLNLTYRAIGRLQLRKVYRQSQSLRAADWTSLLDHLRQEMNIRRPVSLLRSGENVVPMTWGWLRPVVLLPATAEEWPDERRRIVLRHELAHIRRCDCLTEHIAAMVRALYWFNPFVWLAAWRMRVERERACDDLVLSNGCKASDYATHLVEIARTLRPVSCAAGFAMARASSLHGRVSALLEEHRNRKRLSATAAVLMAVCVAGLALFMGACTSTASKGSRSWSMTNPETANQLKRFVAEKQAQAIAGAQAEGKEMLPEYTSFFAAAAEGDWLSVSNIWEDLRRRAPQYEGSHPRDDRLHGTAWQTILETWGAFGNIALGGDKLVTLGKSAVDSIPSGSIYIGGTDPGRCVITALQKTHVQADPFFTLTQNALADSTYLQYLRGMYGQRIYIPTDEDSKNAFNEYLADAETRLKQNKLKPGEDVKRVEGKVNVSGQVAVMAINALLAKVIFDKNPRREFYLEESFPLDWMYPHLSPHGPIMKINREPLSELSADLIRRDHEYWTRTVRSLVNTSLDYDTPLQDIAQLALKTFPKQPKADIYVTPDAATKWASKLRSSIAGVYVWRLANTSNPTEKQRMIKEADFAFRQAFALCPYSPEAVFRYVNLLTQENRLGDAQMVAETAAKLAPENNQFSNLLKEIQRLKAAKQN